MSSLLRICSEDAVAYLKILETCASFVLTEKDDVLTTITEQEKKIQQRVTIDGTDEQKQLVVQKQKLAETKKLFESIQSNKQLIFNRTMEIIRKKNSSSGDGDDVAFRIFSQEERHRMFAAQQNNNNNLADEQQNKVILQTLYDLLLTAARSRIMSSIPQLCQIHNNSNNKTSSSSSTTSIDVSFWPPYTELESALLINKELEDAPTEVTTFLTKPEETLYSILKNIVGYYIMNSNNSKNNSSKKRLDQVISLTDALLIHRLENDAPGVYECTLIEENVHIIARRRARDIQTVSSLSTVVVGTTEQHHDNNNNNSDDSSASSHLEKSLHHLNENDRAAIGLQKKNQQRLENSNTNNNNNQDAAQQQESSNNMVVEYQTKTKSVNIISVNLRADAQSLVDPWMLEKNAYESNPALKTALKRLLLNIVVVPHQNQNQKPTHEQMQKVFSSLKLPPLSNVQNALRICVGSSPRSLFSSLLSSSNNTKIGNNNKVFVRNGVNVSLLNIPEIYLLVPASSFSITSKLAQISSSTGVSRLLDEFIGEESRFEKSLHALSRSVSSSNNNNSDTSAAAKVVTNHLLDATQRIRFSSTFGVDVEKVADAMQLRFFYPGFFYREERENVSSETENNNNLDSTKSSNSSSAAASSSSSSSIFTQDQLEMKHRYEYKTQAHNEAKPPSNHMLFDESTRHYNNLVFLNNSDNKTSDVEQQQQVMLIDQIKEVLFSKSVINSANDDTIKILDLDDEQQQQEDHQKSSFNNNSRASSFSDSNSNNETTKHQKFLQSVLIDKSTAKGLFRVSRIVRIKNTPANHNLISKLFSLAVIHGHRTANGLTAEDDLLPSKNMMMMQQQQQQQTSSNNNRNNNNNNNNSTNNSQVIDETDQYIEDLAKFNKDQQMLDNFFDKEKKLEEERKLIKTTGKNNNSNNNVNLMMSSGSTSSSGVPQQDKDVELLVLRSFGGGRGGGASSALSLQQVMQSVHNEPKGKSVTQTQLLRVLRNVAQFDKSAGGWKTKSTR